MSINTLRHSTIYNDHNDGLPVLIVGMGATGSHLFAQLVCLGVSNITCVDPDVVESHNLANQIYTNEDIGKSKVEAAADWAERKLGEIPSGYKFIQSSMPDWMPSEFSGIVFLLTDTMDSRKTITDSLMSNSDYNIVHMIETRMGAMQGEVYSINPHNPVTLDKWGKTLFSDDLPSAEVSACGTSLTVGSTATLLASLAAWQYINILTNPDAIEEHSKFYTRPLMLTSTLRL